MSIHLQVKLLNVLRPASILSARSFSLPLANGKPGLISRTFSDAKQTNDTKPTQSDGNTYECKEYFGYNEFSYYDIDAACVVKRVPQPKADFKEVS